MKSIRKFSKPRLGVNGPHGKYIIRITESPGNPDRFSRVEVENNGDEGKTEQPYRINGTLSPLSPITNHIHNLKRRRKERKERKEKMRLVNLEFKTMDKKEAELKDKMNNKDKLPPITTTLTFSDYLCKWCLAYVGQRRQFCSADCAAQFKLCQRKRDQKRNLNISVDYYGNVKLSIQGQPLASSEEFPVTSSYPSNGGARRGRRRKRCRNCAKLLKEDADDEYCDETCLNMDVERNKREDFVNVFQQKETAERRRIRKWLIDAQDNYTKQQGDFDPMVTGEHLKPDYGKNPYNTPVDMNPTPDFGMDVTSGPAALNPLPVVRTPLGPPVFIAVPSPKLFKDLPSKSGGPSYSLRNSHYIPERGIRLRSDETITGGPVALNPIPLRKGPIRPDRHRAMDPGKRQLMIDLKWIPKFYG